MSSSSVLLKTRRVRQRSTLNLSRAQTSSRWCGVVVRRGACQLRCRSRQLTMVQNSMVRRQKPSCSLTVRRKYSLTRSLASNAAGAFCGYLRNLQKRIGNLSFYFRERNGNI
ncbi:uncharacterized protein TNCV_3810101 [Trichonephila clavipes]|nr:uncharacterized protein TNCV_3810101 [Trichonephila clavipes]